MSTVQAQPSAAAPAYGNTLDVSGTRPVSFGRLVQVELRKTYNTRAGLWLLITIGALVAIAEIIMVAVSITQDGTVQWGDFTGVAAGVTSVLLPVLGIMLVTSEWSQRTAMVTFTLEPRRPLVLMAKMLVGLILTAITVVFAVALGALCNMIVGLANGGTDWTMGWRFLVGFLVSQSIAMLAGFALATLLLNTPAAIVVFFVYSYVLPGILFGAAALIGWVKDISPWINFAEAQGPLMDLSMDGKEWAHFAVATTIWLVIPFVVGLWRVLRAEVK